MVDHLNALLRSLHLLVSVVWLNDVDQVLQVDFLASQPPVVEVRPQVLFQKNGDPRSEGVELGGNEPRGHLDADIALVGLLGLSLDSELAGLRESHFIGCLSHNLEETVHIRDQVWIHSYGVEVHEQISEPDVLTEYIPGLDHSWAFGPCLLYLSFALDLLVEVVIKLVSKVIPVAGLFALVELRAVVVLHLVAEHVVGVVEAHVRAPHEVLLPVVWIVHLLHGVLEAVLHLLLHKILLVDLRVRVEHLLLVLATLGELVSEQSRARLLNVLPHRGD